MSSHYRLSLITTIATAPLIALLRRHTGKPLSELRVAITTQQPILDKTPHHNEYSSFVLRATKLIDDLDAEGIPYSIEINGEEESSEYLRNKFQMWHDIGVETRMMSDLESGAPCIETLEWLKRGSPSDVFFTTLAQIVEGTEYNVDEVTLEWAKSELRASEPDSPSDRAGQEF